MRKLVPFVLVAAPLLAQETTNQSVEFIESWPRWSRDTIKAWQESKVLHGDHLDKAKRLVGGIETKVARLKKAVKLEDLFDSHVRDDRLKAIDALLEKSSKQKKKVALQNLKSDLKAQLVAYTAQRRLLFEIGGDLESMRVLMNYRLKETKDLKPEKRQELEKHLGQLEVTAQSATVVSQWCEGVELRINEIMATIEAWVEELGG